MIKVKILGLGFLTAALSTVLATSALADGFAIEARMPDFEPVENVQPVYPRRALEKQVSGYTLVEYTINEKGRTENVKVVDSEPNRVFDRASEQAISRTVYDAEDVANSDAGKYYRLYVYELEQTDARDKRLASRR